MDYFNLNATTGAADPPADAAAKARIDYVAFCAFCNAAAAPLDVSPAVTRLRRMVMAPGAGDAFARRDALGAGVISRVDLAEAMREVSVF